MNKEEINLKEVALELEGAIRDYTLPSDPGRARMMTNVQKLLDVIADQAKQLNAEDAPPANIPLGNIPLGDVSDGDVSDGDISE